MELSLLELENIGMERNVKGQEEEQESTEKIKTLVTEVENRCMLAKPARQLDLTSIITILLEGNLVRMETKESVINCALVNCQSVVNKTADHGAIFYCFLYVNIQIDPMYELMCHQS